MSPLSRNYSDTFSTVIHVYSSRNVDLGNDTKLCNSFATLTLDTGNLGASCLWNNGATSQSIVANTTGLYTVTVTNGNICSPIDSTQVTIADSIQWGNTVSLCGFINGIVWDAGNSGSGFIWGTGDTS
jgi:hypothetical protein